MKKIVSLFISLSLCFTLMTPAFAEETVSTVYSSNSPAAVGSILAFIKDDGTLWTQGKSNSKGWLGIGKEYTGIRSGINRVLDDVIYVDTSTECSAAIKSDHTLWMWGENWAGQLGTGDVAIRFTPTKVLDDVVAVSCSGTHTAAIKSDGSLWAWGRNYFGEVGVDEANYSYDRAGSLVVCQTVPVKVLDNVTKVCCSNNNSTAVKADGSLWVWGDNTMSQLGDGIKTNHKIEQVNGIVNPYQSTPIKVMDGVIDVSCGNSTYVIKSDGSLWGWGANDYGQLGNNGECNVAQSYYARAHQTTPVKIMDDVKAIVNCGSSAMALKSNGSLWTWGSNATGIIGNGEHGRENIQHTPLKIMSDVIFMNGGGGCSIAVRSDHSLWAWGRNIYNQFGENFGNAEDEFNIVIQTIPVKIMDGVVAPESDVNSIPSLWAKGEVDAAIAAGFVPDNLQKNYQEPVSRGEVTQMFINLIEQSSGKSVDRLMDEKGVSVNKDAFTDTSDYAVLAANALGIINGTGNSQFSPNGTFTRGQIAAIINRVARVLGVNTDGYTHSFTDVVGHWADTELGWPSSVGIINGVGNNKFSPDTELTTEQAIAITYRALQVLKQ